MLFGCVARELACLDCFGAEGIGPDPPQSRRLPLLQHFLASSPFSNTAVNTSTFEAFTFGKKTVLGFWVV